MVKPDKDTYVVTILNFIALSNEVMYHVAY